MSMPDEHPLPCGSGRFLMLGTVVLATAAAAVLAAGAQDARLLRLGLVAALWAALFGAFAVARMRREISSGASRADELRTAYQLELERAVAARREHTLTAERELRDQTTQFERREIAVLRAELAAMRASLEKLACGNPPGERARLVQLPAHPRKDPEFRFGPGRRYQPELDIPAPPPAHSNGGGTRRAAREVPVVGTQCSVNDLLAAHGADSPPRRRRSRENGPQAATGA